MKNPPGPRRRIIATKLSFRALAALAGISTRTLQRAKRDNRWPVRKRAHDRLTIALNYVEYRQVHGGEL